MLFKSGEFTLHFGSEVDDVNLGMGEQWWLTLMTTYTGNIIKVVSDQKSTQVSKYSDRPLRSNLFQLLLQVQKYLL